MKGINLYPKTSAGQGKWIAVIAVLVIVIAVTSQWSNIKGLLNKQETAENSNEEGKNE